MDRVIRFSSWVAAALGLSALFFLVLSQATTLQDGYVVLTRQGDAPLPVATALFSFSNPQGVLTSEAGVAAVQPIRRGRIYAAPSILTGLALANPLSQPVLVQLTLRDANGIVQPPTASISLAPREHVARYIQGPGGLFPGLSPQFTGSLTFEAAQPIGAVTLRQAVNENGELLLATLPVVDLDATAPGATLIFPQLGVGVFDFAGRQIRVSTQIVMINRSGQTATGEIRLTGSNGNPLVAMRDGETGSAFPYQLPPNGVLSTEFTSMGAPSAGYAQVLPDPGSPIPAGTAVFLYGSNQSAISEAGVADSPPTRRARIFVDNNRTTTGVALASPGNAALTVTFRLLDRNGISIAITTRTIPANGHTAVNVDELFPIQQGFTGQMEISAEADFVPITLKLTINTRNDLVLTTLPVADALRPVTAQTLIFPQIGLGSASIGSFATRLIFINLDATATAVGTMAFFRSDGQPLELALGGGRDSQFDYEVIEEGARQFFPGVEAELASLTLDQSNLVVNQGGVGGLRPVTLDTEGNARDDFPLTFTSLNPATVAVDDNGTLTGLQRGFATVTVQSGAFVVNASVTVATITAGPAGFEVSDIKRDSSNQIYLTNSRAHTILRADSVSDAPSVFAGVNLLAGFNNGPRLNSRFDEPAFMAINVTRRTIYVSDSDNNLIRQVDYGENGAVSLLAGNSDRQPGSADGPPGSARFNNPQGLAIDFAGGVWVVDTGNHTVRRIDLARGTVETVAGSPGVPGSQDGLGGAARFNGPIGVALEVESLESQLGGAAGGQPSQEVRVIVADTGNGLLRRITLDLDSTPPFRGQVTTVEAATVATASLGNGILKQRSPIRFQLPTGVVVDPFGNIYVSEPSLSRVRLLLTTGEVVQAAQSGTFLNPRGLDITTAGRVVVAETSRGAQEIRYAGPSIDTVSPDRLSSQGDQRVTITGSNFATDSRVLLGGTLISGVQVSGTTRITFTTPPGLPSGRTTLTVQHRGGLDQEDVTIEPVPPGSLDRGEITTIAGGRAFGGDLRRATEASLRQPSGIVFDSAGNLIISDAINSRVRRVNPTTRVINTIAGAGRNRLQVPVAVAVDSSDNVYITDTSNHRILRWNRATRLLEPFAGTGVAGFSGDGGPAGLATFFTPAGVAVAENGDVFVADSGNGRIRRIDAESGRISTFAGGPAPAGVAPSIRLPLGLAFDSAGNLHAADILAQRIWRITPEGQVSSVVGIGTRGFSGDGGPAGSARLDTPYAVAFDSSDNLLIADSNNHRARLVNSSTGIIQTLAGNGVPAFSGDGMFAGLASLDFPTGVAFSDADEAYITDTNNHRIRVVSSNTGVISTYVGNGLLPDTGDDGPAIAAALNFPEGLDQDPAGRLHMADSDHHRVRRLSMAVAGAGSSFKLGQSGELLIETVAGTGERSFFGDGQPAVTAAFIQPGDVAFDDEGNLPIADSGNNRIRRVTAGRDGLIPALFGLGNTAFGGAVATLAGNGEAGFSGDGQDATTASLNRPAGVVALGEQIFIADTRNHRVRTLNLRTRVITTLAGNGEAAFSGDGGPAAQASLNSPSALEIGTENGSNVLYIADTGNHRIRRVVLPTGGPAMISTLAGNGQAGFSGDGGSARSASLNQPGALAVDEEGGLLLADNGNNRIRRVDPATGLIQTVAGNGQPGFSGDGGPALNARFNGVGGLNVDAAGNIYVSDLANHRVRFIRNP